jgi:ABC-type Zn uptake system ZnuABC Zn-binding protein ZnuA
VSPRRRYAALAVVITGIATVAGAESLRVVATIEPLAMLVREIGGDRVEVAVLVPPGASPHTFEPQPSDVAALARAVLLVEAGAGLDGWVRTLAAAATPAPPRATVADAPGLGLLAASEAHAEAEAAAATPHVDPHVWLDPIRVRDAVVPALLAALVSADPAGRAGHEERARAFQTRLGELDADVRRTLAGRGTRFVAFHAAWRYFAARYGLEEIGVVEEAPGEEPAPRALAALVTRARAADVPAILVEPQLSPRVAQVLAAEFGATTVLVDPNGDPTDPERSSYAALMRFNARAFARALGGAP